MSQQAVQVIKQDEYRVGQPAWQPSVVESMVNRYQMIVQPLSFTKDRCSYSFRAPSSSCVLNPNMFVEMDFELSIPGCCNR